MFRRNGTTARSAEPRPPSVGRWCAGGGLADTPRITCTVAVGHTLQLRAIGHDTAGRSMGALAARWESTNLRIVRVGNTGLVTALAPGVVIVMAQLGQATDTALIGIDHAYEVTEIGTCGMASYIT